MDEKKKAEAFDMIILGFGKGGKTLAGAAAAAGKRVAIVERSAQMYGGTCINRGCIPTKFLVNRARKAMEARTMEAHAVCGEDGECSFDKKNRHFQEAMTKKEQLVLTLRGKNFDKLNSNPNVTVINGTASFLSPHVIRVEQEGQIRELEGEQIFINTGSCSWMPPGMPEFTVCGPTRFWWRQAADPIRLA